MGVAAHKQSAIKQRLKTETLNGLSAEDNKLLEMQCNMIKSQEN